MSSEVQINNAEDSQVNISPEFFGKGTVSIKW